MLLINTFNALNQCQEHQITLMGEGLVQKKMHVPDEINKHMTAFTAEVEWSGVECIIPPQTIEVCI